MECLSESRGGFDDCIMGSRGVLFACKENRTELVLDYSEFIFGVGLFYMELLLGEHTASDRFD